MAENDFREWIGRSTTRGDQVTPRSLAEYRATLGPWLFERDADVAPPGFHWGLAPATPSLADTGPDGSEAKGLFLPPIPYPRRMWAGGRVENHGAIGLGDDVIRTSTIKDVQFREGKSGRLCLVSIEHDIGTLDLVHVRERQDLVFREAQSQTPAGQMAPFEPGALAWTVDATPLLLFRFSAFTFNGHRIHYDQAFSEEEGYSAPLVHGPMQAALMLNQLSVKMGAVPEVFDYRCLAPLPGGARFTVSTDSDFVARVIRRDGVTTAEGRARVRGT